MNEEEARQQRGMHNPQIVDLITPDESTGEVVLVMLEERPWNSVPDHMRQVEAKFNAYLEYVLGGHFVKQYPQYEGVNVCFRIDCVENPPAKDNAFFNAMSNFAAGEGLRLVVAVMQQDA